MKRCIALVFAIGIIQGLAKSDYSDINLLKKEVYTRLTNMQYVPEEKLLPLRSFVIQKLEQHNREYIDNQRPFVAKGALYKNL